MIAPILSPKGRLLVIVIAVFASGMASVQADQSVKSTIKIPTTIKATINSICDNSGASKVTLDGTIQVNAFKENFIFKNNKRGTRTTNMISVHEPGAVPLMGAVTLPKQPSQDGVGGNAHLSILFRDAEGKSLMDEVYLGRCVQGFVLEAQVLSQLQASSTVQIEDCRNKKGPTITVDCDVTISGISATLILRNNLKGTHTVEVTTDVALTIEGSTMHIPKRRIKGGVGRNPFIGMQFLREDETPMCEPVIFGRCNQL